jgi:hypothetical protein
VAPFPTPHGRDPGTLLPLSSRRAGKASLTCKRIKSSVRKWKK